MSKQEKINNFNPSQPGLASDSLYGLPFTSEESAIIILPVPWEATVSYGSGASEGPAAILKASFQVDLHHQDYPELWKQGIFYDFSQDTLQFETASATCKKLAQPIILALESGENIAGNNELSKNLTTANQLCAQMVDAVKTTTLDWLSKGKKTGLLGGDHSTPLGYYQALAMHNTDFGILHIDAHMDLRIAYEGFEFSHASIMYNALKIDQISKIVQVGIRDFCAEEVEVAKANNVIIFTDRDLKYNEYKGKNWDVQCDEIISNLPQKVTVSFDIDGLQAWYCPNTGTPVPGGLTYEKACYLLQKLTESDKEIIGFDLVEVAPGDDEWDGNVGARLLFELCGMLAKNNGLDVGTRIDFLAGSS